MTNKDQKKRQEKKNKPKLSTKEKKLKKEQKKAGKNTFRRRAPYFGAALRSSCLSSVISEFRERHTFLPLVGLKNGATSRRTTPPQVCHPFPGCSRRPTGDWRGERWA